MNKADGILVSFCLPTLNRVDYLKTFLDSFLCNIPIWGELIVVDGGSVDGTRELLRDLAQSNDRMKLIESRAPTNLGLDLFECVRSSHGKYCWFISDDDGIEHAYLNELHQFLLDGNYPGVTVSYQAFDNKLISKLPTVRPNFRKINSKFREYKSVSQLFLDLGQHLGYLPCQIIKRQALIYAIDSDVLQRDDVSNPWVITLIIGEVMARHSEWCFLQLPVIKNRTENDSTLSRVGEFQRQVITHVEFWKVFSRYCEPSVLRLAKSVYLRTRYLRSIITLKAREPDRGVLDSIKTLHYQAYSDIWIFHFLFPLLFMPSSFYSVILKFYKKARSIS